MVQFGALEAVHCLERRQGGENQIKPEKIRPDCVVRDEKMRPYQGFWGFREKGHLFSGSWGALANILRDLGSKQRFREQKKKTFRELRKNKSGSWGEGLNFFQGAGSKDPPPPLVGPQKCPGLQTWIVIIISHPSNLIPYIKIKWSHQW